MLSAAMQTCSAALNSSATLLTYDVAKRWRPDTSDHQMVLIGKVSTVIVTILAIFLSPIFGHYSTIIEGMTKLISYVSPPITTVFVVGVFWKRASAQAAFITLISGAVLGAAFFALDWYHIYQGDFMLNAFALFAVCTFIMILASLLLPEAPRPEAHLLIWADWREPLRSQSDGQGWSHFRLATAGIFLIFVVLYIVFR
jgi:SSS family solute:Na+ symporter